MDTAKLSQIKKALSGQQDDGQDVARLRTGVISAVNTNGTVDVTLSGVTVAGVPHLMSAGIEVGTIVQLLSYRGSLLVLGTSAGSGQSIGGSWYDEVDTNPAGTTSTTGTAYMSVTLPGPGTYAFSVHLLFTLTTATGVPGFALGGTSTPSSYRWASVCTPAGSTTGQQGLQASGTSYPTNVEILSQTLLAAVATYGAILINGRVTVTAGGTLTFRVGRTSGTGTVNIKDSSNVSVRAVNGP